MDEQLRIMMPLFPRRFVFVLAAFLLMVLLYVDRVCISTAEEHIRADLGLSEQAMGWILSAFALGYALCQTPAGMLADRLGPRRTLSAIVAFWSLFTGLTAGAWNFASMLVVRFVFGAGEAGALPGVARAVYSWIPLSERGIVQGISFSGMRLGAAFAMPGVAWMIQRHGWQASFAILMGIGFTWAVVWYVWFRDDPAQVTRIRPAELEYILATRQQAVAGDQAQPLSAAILFGSRNLWLAMGQYFAGNFTFFFCLTWLYPHVKQTYHLDAVEAGFYAMAPLVCGALGNIFSGWLVDFIYRRGRWPLSRRLPAIIGFLLAAVGMAGSVGQETPLGAIIWLSVAIFGADMTLPPSWSFCVDIGRKHSGAVSGTMNMAGNLGAFLTGLAFPYLHAWTKTVDVFFYVGAVLNVLAAGLWLAAKPDRKLEEY
jgi:ACS family glucarate transporter-like MFS transporter